MAIVFGTDFSPQAAEAARAAAALAQRTQQVLHLVHVTEYGSVRSSAVDEALRQEAAARLEAQAAELRHGGPEVAVHLLEGAPDEVLVEHATLVHASLLVLAHQGQRAPRWRLGNVAERTAQASRCPVLVLRSARPLEEWARGSRRLRVLLGLDFSAPAQAAAAWVRQLRQLGPCEVVVAHHYWGVDAHVRYGVAPSLESAVSPQVEEALRRDLTARLGDMPGQEPVWVHLEAGVERPSDTLVALARRESVDLVVLGTHQRTGPSRWWYGSVSQRVLHEAPVSVLCVPQGAAQPGVPSVRRALVPTDLSEPGLGALRYAYSLLPPGGAVYLLHVLESDTLLPSSSEELPERERILRHLRSLVPPEAAAHQIATYVEVVPGRRVSEAICQAAERLGCDLICLATHGRSGLSKALVGSVAQEVLRHAPRPILLVHPR
jgi:nucleotide-binding universal stress UspA family protein